jgi:hypothetical protein
VDAESILSVSSFNSSLVILRMLFLEYCSSVKGEILVVVVKLVWDPGEIVCDPGDNNCDSTTSSLKEA